MSGFATKKWHEYLMNIVKVIHTDEQMNAWQKKENKDKKAGRKEAWKEDYHKFKWKDETALNSRSNELHDTQRKYARCNTYHILMLFLVEVSSNFERLK